MKIRYLVAYFHGNWLLSVSVAMLLLSSRIKNFA